jgi:hypothetical protein
LGFNTCGLVILNGDLIHIYAVNNKWLKEAIDNNPSGIIMDARPAYIRTEVILRDLLIKLKRLHALPAHYSSLSSITMH